MLKKQEVLKNTSQTSLKYFCLVSICFLLLTALPIQSAKAEIRYGPIKSGQSLWDIAKKTRPDNSISIEQLAYAIYNANPDAFQSGNMNLLKKNVFLIIPDSAIVLKTSDAEAKQQLTKHVHALELLRADAKQLRRAKANTLRYKKQLRRLQKRLAHYRYRSKRWNIIYKQLVKAKRRHARSKHQVVKLRALLLEKATLVATKPTPKEHPQTTANSINEQLSQIQKSLINLGQSNQKLVDKVEELSTLNQRVVMLEEELGKNDELVIQLKKTMEVAQKAITAQQQLNEHFNQRLDALSANDEKPEDAYPEAPSAPQNNESEKENKPAEAASITGQDTSNPPSTVIAATNKDVNSQATKETRKEPAVETNDKPFDSNTALANKVKLLEKTSEKQKLTIDYNDEYTQASFSPEESPSANRYSTAVKTDFKPHQSEPVATPAAFSTSNSPMLNPKRVNNRQRKVTFTSNVSVTDRYMKIIKEKVILIGTIINGIILLFVLFRLFSNKQKRINQEETNSKTYTSWQEREKPKHA